MIITGAQTLTWDQWCRAVEDLEARAAAAERSGLPRTAKSWRERIANLRIDQTKEDNHDPAKYAGSALAAKARTAAAASPDTTSIEDKY